MKKIIFALCWALVAATTTVNADEKLKEFEKEFAVPFNGQNFDDFDWRLCTEVAKSDGGNALMSPISVKFFMTLLYEGSTGETAKELEKKLHLLEDKTMARMKSSAILRSLQASNPKYKLEFGTKIFIDESMTPKTWFQRILFLYYNTYVEKMNLKDYDSRMRKINKWVESVTHGHIKDFIDQESVKDASMVLAAAIYFKGSWESYFGPENTFLGDFETSEGSTKVFYMKQINNFYYTRSEDFNAQILRLPYEGQKYAMYIILPEEKDGLENLDEITDLKTLKKNIEQMEETSVEVILPKFKFERKTDFEPILRRFGLNKIFDSFGDMKGLTQSEKGANLIVSSVIQKAKIEIDEEGSVASAASEMQLINKIGIQDELFNASHPFLFFIADESTGSVVFIGKFAQATEEMAKAVRESTTATTAANTFTTTAPAPVILNAPIANGYYRRINSTFAFTRQNNSPKLFELKQKKIKAEMRQSPSLQELGVRIKNGGDGRSSNKFAN